MAALELEGRISQKFAKQSGQSARGPWMKQDFIFYKRAYEDSSQNALWSYMLEYFVQRYEKIAKEKLRTEVLDTQLKFSIRHYCYGSVGMTKEWLLYDNTTSAEVVVEMMFNSMPQELYSALMYGQK